MFGYWGEHIFSELSQKLKFEKLGGIKRSYEGRAFFWYDKCWLINRFSLKVTERVFLYSPNIIFGQNTSVERTKEPQNYSTGHVVVRMSLSCDGQSTCNLWCDYIMLNSKNTCACPLYLAFQSYDLSQFSEYTFCARNTKASILIVWITSPSLLYLKGLWLKFANTFRPDKFGVWLLYYDYCTKSQKSTVQHDGVFSSNFILRVLNKVLWQKGRVHRADTSEVHIYALPIVDGWKRQNQHDLCIIISRVYLLILDI